MPTLDDTNLSDNSAVRQEWGDARGRVYFFSVPSFSFFLKMLENIFLKFPEEVWKRGLSKLDRRGEVCGEWELAVVKDERGRAEKMEEIELEVE